MTATEPRDGVLVPVGCPNCYSPTKGAARMRHIDPLPFVRVTIEKVT